MAGRASPRPRRPPWSSRSAGSIGAPAGSGWDSRSCARWSMPTAGSSKSPLPTTVDWSWTSSCRRSPPQPWGTFLRAPQAHLRRADARGARTRSRMNTRRDRPSRPWFLYALAVVAVAVVALSIAEIGPPTSSARTSTEIVTAGQGVVQSTVTGSGNIAAGTDDTVNFNTSGTLQDVYVHVGQQVHAGQLLADLDSTSAQLSLNQAESSLTAAEDNLSCAQGVTSDCGSGGSGSSGSASTTSYSTP